MSGLGRHHELIKSLAAKAARPLSFLSGNYPDPRVWQGYARKKIFELLHYAPTRVPFAPEIVEETDCRGYLRRKLWFSSSPYTRVSAYLLLPPQSRGTLPCVLCLHDHGGLFAWGKEKLVATDADRHPALAGHKDKWYGGMSVGEELARAGFAVLAIDGFYFGDRRLSGLPETDRLDLATVKGHAEFERLAAESEPLVALNIIQAGATLMGLCVWDAIRSVEFLSTIDGLDCRRIGCFGAFSAGLVAICLSGLCDLVRATCAAGWVTSFARVIEAGVPGNGWCHFAVPGLYNFLDLPDIASLTIPRALFLMAMENEPVFPAGSGESFKKVRRVYEAAQHADDFACQTYPDEPRFSRPMLDDAVRWFGRWL